MIQLKPETIQLLQSFHYFDWFSSMGKPIQEDVIQPRSFEEALEYQDSHDWIDAWAEVSNQFRYCIRHQVSEIKLKEWQVRANLIDNTYPTIHFPQISMLDTLTADVRTAYIWFGLEIEYTELCFPESFPYDLDNLYHHHNIILEVPVFPPKPFATTIAYWYMRGHFPCGWIGGYPYGKLVVY